MRYLLLACLLAGCAHGVAELQAGGSGMTYSREAYGNEEVGGPSWFLGGSYVRARDQIGVSATYRSVAGSGALTDLGGGIAELLLVHRTTTVRSVDLEWFFGLRYLDWHEVSETLPVIELVETSYCGYGPSAGVRARYRAGPGRIVAAVGVGMVLGDARLRFIDWDFSEDRWRLEAHAVSHVEFAIGYSVEFGGWSLLVGGDWAVLGDAALSDPRFGYTDGLQPVVMAGARVQVGVRF